MVKNKKIRGFTLVELMIVVVLVSILAAVTVPKLMEVSDRNKLGEVTNLFQQTVAEARALAVKNRQAVVVEVRNGQMWINLLDGVQCSDGIRKRCFHTFGATADAANTNVVNLSTQEFQNAGVAMCDLRVATITGASNLCTVATIDQGTGIGICYNGSGQLWIRSTVDAATVCGGTTAPDAGAVWEKACVPWIQALGGATDVQTDRFSGVDTRFNRFTAGSGTCVAGGAITPSGAEDITRRVIVPAGGHPFVKMVVAGD